MRFKADLIAKRMMSESRTPRRFAIRFMLRMSLSPSRIETACFRCSITSTPYSKPLVIRDGSNRMEKVCHGNGSPMTNSTYWRFELASTLKTVCTRNADKAIGTTASIRETRHFLAESAVGDGCCAQNGENH
jgi:hypothetical protein